MTTHNLGLTARRGGSVNVLPIGWSELPPPFPAALEVWSVMPGIDLVADLGESFGAWTMGADEAILDLLTSANVACGFHAGDPRTMDLDRSAMRRTRCCDRRPPELSRRGRLRSPRDGSDRRRGPHRHDLPVRRAVGIRRRARHDAVAPGPARPAGQPGRDAAGLRGGGRRRGRRGGPEPRGARAGRVPRRRGPGARPRRRHRGDRRPGLPRRRHAGAAERAGRRHPRRRRRSPPAPCGW